MDPETLVRISRFPLWEKFILFFDDDEMRLRKLETLEITLLWKILEKLLTENAIVMLLI